MRVLLALVMAVAIRPPVIHESFTPLPCPKDPQTTLELEGCYERDILRTDRQIDAKARKIFFKLAPSERAGFVRGERSWLAYRRASCAAEASRYAGGTFSGVVGAGCFVSRNKTHLMDLTELLKTLRS